MFQRGLIRANSSSLNIALRLFDAALTIAGFVFAAWYYGYPWNPHFSSFAVIAAFVFYFAAAKSGLYSVLADVVADR